MKSDRMLRRVFNILAVTFAVLAVGLAADYLVQQPLSPDAIDWIEQHFSFWWIVAALWLVSIVTFLWLIHKAPFIDDMD